MKSLKKNIVDKQLNEIIKVKNMKGEAAAVFAIKEKVVGSKKDNDGPAVVRDPKTNKLIFNPVGILKASVDYCEQLLTNRLPKENFEVNTKWKQRVHNVRMKETFENDVEFTEEMFYESLNILKKKKGNKYKFVLNGGKSLHAALIKLFRIVWEKEENPNSWRGTLIVPH